MNNSIIIMDLPLPIATVWENFGYETSSSFTKLHRLIDVFEVLLKYLGIIAIQDFYRCNLDQRFPDIDHIIKERIQRPYLGDWHCLLEKVLYSFRDQESEIFAKELYLFYYPEFGNSPNRHQSIQEVNGFINLRNALAHGAVLSETDSAARISEFEPRIRRLLQKAMPVLQNYQLYNIDSETSRISYYGRIISQKGHPEIRLKSKTRLTTGHVYLYDLKYDRYLDLDPLITFTTCKGLTANNQYCDEEKPLFFNGTEQHQVIQYLDYTKGHHSYFDFNKLEVFKKAFPSSERQGGEWFNQLIEEKTENFTGRSEDIQFIENFLTESSKNTLVISGHPGIGKTTLLAKFSCRDVEGVLKKSVRHFFRAGDKDSLDIGAMYANLTLQLSAIFLTRPPYDKRPESIADQRQLFLRTLNETSEKVKEPAIVIILDGIDELVRSRPESEEILKELPYSSRLPKNVKLILSTRDDLVGHPLFAQKFPNPLKRKISKLSADDIRSLLFNSFSKYTVLENSEYINLILKKSEGHPLYLKLLLDDLRNGLKKFGDQKILLSQGMLEYFREILERISHQTIETSSEHRHFQKFIGDLANQGLFSRTDARLKSYQENLNKNNSDRQACFEMLALLCMVFEPVDIQMVLAVIGVDEKTVANLFNIIKPLITQTEDKKVTLFHASFQEFILEQSMINPTRLNPYQQEISNATEKLHNWMCLWKEHKHPYAIKFIPTHLAAIQGCTDEIINLAFDADFLAIQGEHNIRLPIETINLALRSAIKDQKLSTIGKLALVLSQCIETTYLETPLYRLKQTGSIETALKAADLFPAKQRILWYMLIAEELNLQGYPKAAVSIILKLAIFMRDDKLEGVYLPDELVDGQYKSLCSNLFQLITNSPKFRETPQLFWDIGTVWRISLIETLIYDLGQFEKAKELAKRITKPSSREMMMNRIDEAEHSDQTSKEFKHQNDVIDFGDSEYEKIIPGGISSQWIDLDQDYGLLITQAKTDYFDTMYNHIGEQKNLLLDVIIEYFAQKAEWPSVQMFMEYIDPKAISVSKNILTRAKIKQNLLNFTDPLEIKNHSMEVVCDALMGNHDYEKAREVAEQAKLYYEQAQAWCYLAGQQFRNGEPVNALSNAMNAVQSYIYRTTYDGAFDFDYEFNSIFQLLLAQTDSSIARDAIKSFAQHVPEIIELGEKGYGSTSVDQIIRNVLDIQVNYSQDDVIMSLELFSEFLVHVKQDLQLQDFSNSPLPDLIRALVVVCNQYFTLGQEEKVKHLLNVRQDWIEWLSLIDENYFGEYEDIKVKLARLLSKTGFKVNAEKLRVRYDYEEIDWQNDVTVTLEFLRWTGQVDSQLTHEQILKEIDTYMEDIDEFYLTEGDPYEIFAPLYETIQFYANIGDLDFAEKIAEFSWNDTHRGSAISSIARTQIKNKNFDAAIRLIKMIKEHRTGSLISMLHEISKDQSLLGSTDLIVLMGSHKATTYCFCRYIIQANPEILDDVDFTMTLYQDFLTGATQKI